ncbi:hypothetical protein YC2023_084404 [Brassica napus]
MIEDHFEFKLEEPASTACGFQDGFERGDKSSCVISKKTTGGMIGKFNGTPVSRTEYLGKLLTTQRPAISLARVLYVYLLYNSYL